MKLRQSIRNRSWWLSFLAGLLLALFLVPSASVTPDEKSLVTPPPQDVPPVAASQPNTAIQPTSPPVYTSGPIQPIPPSNWPPRPPLVQPGSIPERPIVAINPNDGAEMVYIPAGAFKMGDPSTGDDAPEHQVTLDGYWMYKTPVTVAQYRAFCKATGREMPTAPDWGWKGDHPIVNVTWDDAKAYCDWAKASLPTEAEWEKAARGTAGRAFPWGNIFNGSLLWCSKGTFGDAKSTFPAGSFPGGASPYGCLDMAGNVWQWCSDWYDKDYYTAAPSHNPTGPDFGTSRVVRGGSWYYYGVYYFRCGFRGVNGPTLRYYDYGFRCCVRAG